MFQIYKKIRLTGLVLLCAEWLVAQSLCFKQYQVTQGLSHNSVSCCVQDARGFMWFGTRDGLNRFDGHEFRVFNLSSIGNNSISATVVDNHGALWVGCNRGLYKYNSETESLSLVPFTENMNIHEILFDLDGDLWIILNNELVRYTERLNLMRIYNLPENDIPSCICMTQFGQLWIGSVNGMLYELDKDMAAFKSYDMFSHTTNVNSLRISCIKSVSTSDRILVGTYAHGMKLFDIARKDYTDCFHFDNNKVEVHVHDFLQTKDEEIWVATESGLFVYNLRTGEYYSVNRPYDPYSLSSIIITSLYQDHEGGIWLGTYGGGINYHSPFQLFEKYYSYPDENALKGKIVHDICTDKNGDIWIATEDAGLNKYDVKTRKYTNYQPKPDGSGISHINIQGLFLDEDKLWVGSISGWIDVINIRNGNVEKHYSLNKTAGSRIVIVNMKQLNDGQFYVTTSNGVFLYNKKSDDFEFMPQYPTHRVQSILKDHEGIVWTGTVNNGLYYLPEGADICSHFKDNSLPLDDYSTINDIYEDEHNNLWFATPDGIFKYDRAKCTRYSVKEGLPSNIIFRILPDEHGNLWITTTNGLVCLNPYTEKIKVYTQEHGLIINQFSYNSGWKDSEGRLYFGMVNGLIRFNPDAITAVSDKASVQITKINALNDSFSVSSEELLRKHVKLNYNQSTFYIVFSSLSYVAPGNTKYAFCMEGYDSEWTYLTNSYTAYYTKLPAGTYTFKVKASNFSGLWNDDFSSIQIIIGQPWWFSRAAIIIYVGLLACIAAINTLWVIRKNKRKLKRSIALFENEKEKELYKNKINNFINISHEIRTPLTLICSPLQKALKDEQLSTETSRQLEIANRNALRLHDLINQLLDIRKMEVKEYGLNFIQTDIVRLIQEVTDLFISTINEKQLTMEIKYNTNLREVFIDREACRKIISNLLSNALKYAHNSITIFLTFNDAKETFTLDVCNDGKSIPKEIRKKIFEPFFSDPDSEYTSGAGIGLALAQSLAEMHRGSLTLINDTELTTFRLTLPVNQSYAMHLVDDETAATIPHQKIDYTFDKNRPTVLIVEDNIEMQHYIGDEIHASYNVITASNGNEALLRLQEYSIQLIILDIMMPVMDGFTLLKKIKTDIDTSHIPVIILSALTTQQNHLEGLALGADKYLDKPFSGEVLTTQMSSLINNHKAIRTLLFNSPLAHIKTMAYSKTDTAFILRLNNTIEKYLSDELLDVGRLSNLMNLSRSNLYRKIKLLTDFTPSKYIRFIRLKKAAEMIATTPYNITEIAETVGFNTPAYFSHCFAKSFGVSPSQYAKSLHNKPA